MTKTMFGRALAVSLLLATATAAQAGGYYGGGGAPATASTFFSPIQGGTLGSTTFAYALPATGRLRISGIGNGGPGGSGGTGLGAIRTGGGGGGPGQRLAPVELSVAWLQSQFPGITAIAINFGSLGTPGAAQSGTTAAGSPGVAGSNITLSATGATGTPVILSISPGQPGGAGAASGSAASGGAAGGQFGQFGSVPFNGGAASQASGGVGVSPTTNAFGPTGGASGGGLSAANTEVSGGQGSYAYENSFSVRAAGSALIGGSTTPSIGDGKAATLPFYGPALIPGLGGSGGSSSASASVVAGAGGPGSGYGAGAGGGGAGTNGATSGAGGSGSYGALQIDALPY